MSIIQIKHRWTDAILFERELPEKIASQSRRRQRGWAIKQALAAGVSLRGSDLRDSDLSDSDLSDSDLRGSNLSGSDLRDSDLSGSDLRDSDLSDSDLSGSDLSGAVGVGETNGSEALQSDPAARATRQAARAARYRERHPDVPVIEALDRRLLGILESGAGTLKMSSWHTCETTHCRAGWAVTLAGDAGRKLEDQYGPYCAGRMIYRASSGHMPNFFASDERALEDIREQAALQGVA